MTSIEVSYFIKYLTNRELSRRDNDWSAFKIRQFVKNEPINGTFTIKVGNQVRTFGNKDKSEVMGILYGALAKRLAAEPQPFSIVPIPNSSAIVGSRASFDTLDIATQVAAKVGSKAKVLPALRWKQKRKQAHKDGGRDSQENYDNLAVVSPISGRVIVFDDFITSGSQMKAACRRLLDAKAKSLSGLTIARVVHEYPDPVFGWETMTLPLFEPPIDLDDL